MFMMVPKNSKKEEKKNENPQQDAWRLTNDFIEKFKKLSQDFIKTLPQDLQEILNGEYANVILYIVLILFVILGVGIKFKE